MGFQFEDIQFYWPTSKEIYKAKRAVFLSHGVPQLLAVGFVRAPFKDANHGNTNVDSHQYTFCRLRNESLELLIVDICNGDRFVKCKLGIYELDHPGTTYEELSSKEVLPYLIPPLNHAFKIYSVRMNWSLTRSGFQRSQKKLASDLQMTIARFFKPVR